MAKKPTLRAGLVGSGFAAAFHYEALGRVPGLDVTITGVYSPRAERRRAFGAARDVPVCDSLETLIGAADVVHICSPPDTHEPVAVAALAAGRHVIIEKPFTGYFGDGAADFNGFSAPKAPALAAAADSVRRLLAAERNSPGRIGYAENWVYAPAVQKEREILEKTGAQILWMRGEEAHSGSHAPSYGNWAQSGGGSLMGKGCHPLSAALYLKRVEGQVRNGRPIRPATVSARIHRLTTGPAYRDAGHLRRDYRDVEDFAVAHVCFEDGTVADITASEIVLGGVHNVLEVAANNHRTICNINPNNAMETFCPQSETFREVYTVEKIGTQEGWACASPDEAWFHGYQHEMEALYRGLAYGEPLAADSVLGADTILTLYAAYRSAEQGGAEAAVPCPEAEEGGGLT